MADYRPHHRPASATAWWTRIETGHRRREGVAMMLWTTILLALREIRRNLLRSFLTVLGIVIGVAAVMAMVTLGNGATQRGADPGLELGSQPADRPARPGPGRGGGAPAAASRSRSRTSTPSAARSAGVAAVAPRCSRPQTAHPQRGQLVDARVTGTTDEYLDRASSWELASGRDFTAAEEQAGKSVCILGETVQDQLYPRQRSGRQTHPRRQRQLRGDRPAGDASGQSRPSAGDQDDTVIMPLHARSSAASPATTIVSIDHGGGRPALRQRPDPDSISQLMRERRNIARRQARTISRSTTRKQIADTLAQHHRHPDRRGHRDRRDQPAGRRHRHHEHHAGVGDRADARDRHPPGHRRAWPRGADAVPGRGGGAVVPGRR